MTDIAVQQPLPLAARRFASLFWIVVVGLALAGLIAAAFLVGRVTADPRTHTIPSVRPVVQQSGPGAPAPLDCRAPGPC